MASQAALASPAGILYGRPKQFMIGRPEQSPRQ